MTSKRKFYKTIITIEVLSESPVSETEVGISEIAYEITDGMWSGKMNFSPCQEIDAVTAAKELIAQGTDPEFFQIDADGNDMEG